MVSLPSLLRMATTRDDAILHTLATMKGSITSVTRGCTRIIDTMQDVPCPEYWAKPEGFENCAELTFKLMLMLTHINKALEDVTNGYRETQGLKTLDYSKSESTQILADWHSHLREEAKKLGCELTADGVLVRS